MRRASQLHERGKLLPGEAGEAIRPEQRIAQPRQARQARAQQTEAGGRVDALAPEPIQVTLINSR